MFLKLTKSAGRQYAQFVESFRNEAGQPRQRTICTLGRLEPGGDVDKLIAALQRARGLEAANALNPLDGLRFEGSRCAGAMPILGSRRESSCPTHAGRSGSVGVGVGPIKARSARLNDA